MTEIRPHGRELLEAARLERTPGPGDRERVLAALLTSAALTTTTAVASASAPSLFAKLTTSTAKWWLLGSLCATAAVGGSYLSAHTPTPPASPTAPPPVHVPVPVPALSPPQLAPTPASPPPTSPRPARRETPSPTLEQELSSLHAAHAAYRNGDSARALSLVTEQQRQFPKSQLSTERSTLHVLTLCRLGRTGQAQALAAKLRAASHGAAALSGLEGSCAATPTK